jgi:hypothetical protein
MIGTFREMARLAADSPSRFLLRSMLSLVVLGSVALAGFVATRWCEVAFQAAQRDPWGYSAAFMAIIVTVVLLKVADALAVSETARLICVIARMLTSLVAVVMLPGMGFLAFLGALSTIEYHPLLSVFGFVLLAILILATENHGRQSR